MLLVCVKRWKGKILVFLALYALIVRCTVVLPFLYSRRKGTLLIKCSNLAIFQNLRKENKHFLFPSFGRAGGRSLPLS